MEALCSALDLPTSTGINVALRPVKHYPIDAAYCRVSGITFRGPGGRFVFMFHDHLVADSGAAGSADQDLDCILHVVTGNSPDGPLRLYVRGRLDGGWRNQLWRRK